MRSRKLLIGVTALALSLASLTGCSQLSNIGGGNTDSSENSDSGNKLDALMTYVQTREPEEILTEAANEPDAWDRRFLWMSRPCGTHCLKEKDVFLYDTSEYHTWTAYSDTADEIVAYAVQLNGYEDGVLKGDLYELDYASHCAMAKNSAVYIAQVKLHCDDRDIIMAYSNDWRLKAQKYSYDKREFIPLSPNKHETLLGEMQKG